MYAVGADFYANDDKGLVYKVLWSNDSGLSWGRLYELVDGDGTMEVRDNAYPLTERELKLYWRKL